MITLVFLENIQSVYNNRYGHKKRLERPVYCLAKIITPHSVYTTALALAF